MDPITWVTSCMNSALNFSILFVSYLCLAGTLLLPLVFYLAAKGKAIGVRRTYVRILLAVFEYLKRTKVNLPVHITKYGRKKIQDHDSKYNRELAEESTATEKTETVKDKSKESEDTDDDSEDEDPGHVIEREVLVSMKGMKMVVQRSMEQIDDDFHLSDIMFFTKSGLEAIIEDEVTQRFSAEELGSWNLLTRTNTKPQFISVKLTVLWAIGFVLRYVILMPFRLTLTITGILLLIIGTAVIGPMPEGEKKRRYYDRLSVTSFRIMSRGLSAVINFHNKENKAKGGGICVANHTSPIDVVILGCDNTYAMVGQLQGGFFGIMERAMGRATSHVWFNRSESRDRHAVARRLREHVSDETKLPILIFPEGTCVNNTSIMMFKKGSFEIGATIYPVAIKYDPRFADAFWNSSKVNFVTHILLMLTSWALVCDVWYLPPETQQEGESAIQFANRIKSKIAEQGGLVDLEWDGALKRSKPKDSFKEKYQEDFSKRLKGE